jgi:Spo0E like sporulation regulatory protein.
MEKEIETLRGKLNRLVEESSCLYSDKVVQLSQELDNLIYTYYLSVKSA